MVVIFQRAIFTGINKKMALHQHDDTSQLNYCSNERFSSVSQMASQMHFAVHCEAVICHRYVLEKLRKDYWLSILFNLIYRQFNLRQLSDTLLMGLAGKIRPS